MDRGRSNTLRPHTKDEESPIQFPENLLRFFKSTVSWVFYSIFSSSAGHPQSDRSMVSSNDSEIIQTKPNLVLALLSRAAAWKPERVFLFLSVFCGILMVFLTPPFQVPDEIAHFSRSYELSQGNFDVKIASMPKSVMDFMRSVSADIPFHTENKQSKKALFAELSRPFQAQPVESGPLPAHFRSWYWQLHYGPYFSGFIASRKFLAFHASEQTCDRFLHQ
jgi:hypothetical protein